MKGTTLSKMKMLITTFPPGVGTEEALGVVKMIRVKR